MRLLTELTTHLSAHPALRLKDPLAFQYAVRVVGRLPARNPTSEFMARSRRIEGLAYMSKTVLLGSQARRYRFCVSH